ncbi:glutamine amidotransferase [Chryseobacterium nepalense]|nr:glutamine amidotransferase [Chryseobacterium nepalense]
MSLKMLQNLFWPGVGHFDYAMQRFHESGMKDKVHDLVVNKKVPVVGVCVGMQMMAKGSDEGSLPGLGWIDAYVHKFDVSQVSAKLPLPHMGWNDIQIIRNTPLLKDLEENPRYYFLHSYYFRCHDPKDAIAKTSYGIDFTSAVNHDNIFGAQFHPEKSHHFGIQLLKNFAEKC